MELLIKIIIYSWIVSVFFGVIIAISYPIFKDSADSEYEVFIPLYNLFGMCSFNGYDEKFALLFLVPFVNIIFMMFMSFKLKDKYSLDPAFSAGLLLLPPVFVPLLAYSNKSREDDEDDEVFEPQVKIQSVDIKGNQVDEFEEEPKEDVDSIFKIQKKSQGGVNNKPYKAKRVRVNQEFIDSAPAEMEKIERVEKGDN